MTLFFTFVAKHYPDVEHLHELEIEIEGALDARGVLLDFDAFRKIVRPVVRLVDGHFLETLQYRCSTTEARALGDQPTGERLLLWFAVRLQLLASARGGGHDGQDGTVTTKLRSLVLHEDQQARFSWP